MNAVSIIEKKKFNKELSQEEINFMVDGYTNELIPDYQMSSLLMAIRLNGMSDMETFYLTKAMINSGEIIDLSDIEGFKIDKHSTGGVGDKVTLIVAPILASLGIPVAKFSGRGLGITGGTVDKLESIKGFNVELSPQQFIDNVNKHKIAVSGQSANLCPADKKLYALRDVTSTVDSIPLIASSIMSKKIASGSDGIVLDVKYGNGAFMKSIEEARNLAETMVRIGESFDKKVKYTLSNMNNPLGYAIGNKIEVYEASLVLQGDYKESKDLYDTSVDVASLMHSISTNVSLEDSAILVKKSIESGLAYSKFKEWIESQGGELSDILNINTKHIVSGESIKSGIIKSINAQLIGEVAVELGAGRLTKEDKLDYNAFIKLKIKQNEAVNVGDILFEIGFNRDIINYKELIKKAQQAFEII